MDRLQEDVLRKVQEKDVHFIRLWFTDVAGTLKVVAISPAELENAFTEGIGFDGSAIQGLTRAHESDLVMHPDARTFRILPWYGNDETTGRMFCEILGPDGEPARSDPRSVLQRALDRASDLGFTFYAHPEIEFYLFHPETNPAAEPKPIDNGSYFDNVSRSLARNFRSEAVKTLESLGIPVEFSHHEAGPGQNEIDLRVSDALSMADDVMTMRVVVDQVALQQGVQASFMPKPMIGYPGNGMHTHFSLFEGDRNAFADPTGEFGLSVTARKFIGGLLHHAPYITALTNQHVNSYKRLCSGFEAPRYITWGKNAQAALVKVPSLRADKPKSARIEYRAIDSAANPYLAYAAILNAGLDGLENDYPLPEPADTDVSALTGLERKVQGIGELPGSLKDAITLMKTSELAASTLGEDAFAYFLENKEHEWAAYRLQVTPFERQRFMH
ncbi:glutamine synthetase family protein [Arcanobacterium sp. S3PF19]|uniref:glutamine synthetase family protein n=1 Tax=Arcanobacterium sp. S3PF19 TaxID=1219585 RepID=UPI00050DA033|nr:glutamine synthetase family protein [Arcanobacterium sp. S3PF19]KGF06435.1 glutamine synthetase [Arcanobacterium sp. S3PF19]